MAGSRKYIPNKAKDAVELIKSGKVKDPKIAMEVVGYSKSSIASATVGRTKEYKEYLATIDDTAITQMWEEQALDPNTTDKRLRFDIGKELVKIKDRNPETVKDNTGSMPVLNMVFEGDVTVKPNSVPKDVNDDVKH